RLVLVQHCLRVGQVSVVLQLLDLLLEDLERLADVAGDVRQPARAEEQQHQPDNHDPKDWILQHLHFLREIPWLSTFRTGARSPATVLAYAIGGHELALRGRPGCPVGVAARPPAAPRWRSGAG